MDRTTKRKVILITAFWVLVGYTYIYRERTVTDFRYIWTKEKWQTEEPKGQLIGGKKNGEWITYFANGQVAAVEHYKDDTLHGLQILYTPDGYFKRRVNFNMGVRVDSLHTYNSNGRVNIAEYRDSTGTLQGPFGIYDDNGQLIQAGQYADGKFDGEFRTFYRTGELKTIQYYRMGERTGKWLEFSVDGDTTKVERY